MVFHGVRFLIKVGSFVESIPTVGKNQSTSSCLCVYVSYFQAKVKEKKIELRNDIRQ